MRLCEIAQQSVSPPHLYSCGRPPVLPRTPNRTEQNGIVSQVQYVLYTTNQVCLYVQMYLVMYEYCTIHIGQKTKTDNVTNNKQCDNQSVRLSVQNVRLFAGVEICCCCGGAAGFKEDLLLASRWVWQCGMTWSCPAILYVVLVLFCFRFLFSL